MSDGTDRTTPSGLRRREALVGGALIAAAGVAFARTPRTPEAFLGKNKLEKLLPNRFAGWSYQSSSGLVLPPPDQLRDRLYSQLLTQLYTREDGAAVMLLIAYSGTQDGTVQVHRPEVCYPASGFRILDIEPLTTKMPNGLEVPGRFLLTEGPSRNEQLIYWTRIGSHFPVKWIDSHLAVMSENLHGIIPDGVLVRISTNASGDARPLLQGFAREMVSAASPRLRQVLLGRGEGRAG